MSTDPKDMEDVWKKGNEYIPIRTMSNVHLKRAKMRAQKKELEHFRKVAYFSDLAEKFDKEGERRGLKMPEYDTEYYKNKRILQKASSDEHQRD